MEIENNEQEILLEPEFFTNVGDGTLTIQKNGTDVGTFSANQSEDTTIDITVPTTTSELTNDANFQNANDLSNTISAHNQSSSAHSDIRQAITDEATTRLNADNGLQGQIDAITSSSDVVDIVGTYAELQAYDTQHLQDNDVIKVLQDETHNDAMTYWRWDKETETWTYIGAEGPYYTKSETNTLLDEKLDADEVPNGFFDGPATVTPTADTTVEVDGGLKLKSVDLYGDTTQQTYSGKNLLPSNSLVEQTLNQVVFTPVYNDNGELLYINANGTATGNNHYDIGYIDFTQGLDYTISGCDSGAATTYRLWTDADSAFPTGNRLNCNDKPNTKTAQASESNCLVYIQIFNGAVLNNVKFYPQIEQNSSFTSYEPYVGGTASPNPDYPQNINAVTGTQTITLTDGDSQTTTYTVDLGSIELCKIGNYQDYIYKSGDDWYVHKEIKKMVFDGSSDENWDNLVNTKLFRIRITDLVGQDDGNEVGPILSDNYAPAKYNDLSSVSSVIDYGIALRATVSNGIGIKNIDVANLAGFKTWLSNNNTTVYTPYATPTDTKITNQNLISQLNALLNATLYQPTTTISSSGSLSAIIGVEAFTENLNSLLEIASEPEDNVFTGTDGVNAGTVGLVPAPATSDANKFLKADGTWASAGGGGGGSYTAGTGIDITSDVISVDTSAIQEKLTAGTNVNISAQNVISATDTTYSDFVGTDGNTGGTAGLVPAPTTSDTDKFLKSDGTWATAGGGGGGVTVVQTTGTSTTDVMSQNAVSSMVFADPGVGRQICIGGTTSSVSNYAIRIGAYGQAANTSAVSIGNAAQATGMNSIAMGADTLVQHRGSVALGSSAQTTVKGQIMVGTSNTYDGYNSTNYRLVSGVHDGQSANDAVTVGQVNSVIDNINSALNINIPHIGA